MGKGGLVPPKARADTQGLEESCITREGDLGKMGAWQLQSHQGLEARSAAGCCVGRWGSCPWRGGAGGWTT